MLPVGRKRSINDGNKKEPLMAGEPNDPSLPKSTTSGVTAATSFEPEVYAPPCVLRGRSTAAAAGNASLTTCAAIEMTEPASRQATATNQQESSSHQSWWDSYFGSQKIVDLPRVDESGPSNASQDRTSTPPPSGLWGNFIGAQKQASSSNVQENSADQVVSDGEENKRQHTPALQAVAEGQPFAIKNDPSRGSWSSESGKAATGGPAFLTIDPTNKTRASNIRADEDGEEISSKIPAEQGWRGYLRRLQTTFAGPLLLVPIFLFTITAMVYGASEEFGYGLNLAQFFENIDWDEELNVAFIGNAYLFLNDVPRVVEAISEGQIYQNSVIHPGGSLASLFQTGNGMYNAWRTEEADIGGVYYENYGGYKSMYDYGCCTVRQILQGYDDYIGYGNPYGRYKDDGSNPCIVDEYYASYVSDYLAEDSPRWNYVVLVEQTKRVVIEDARSNSLMWVGKKYAPLLNASKAVPVIIQNHAFWSENTNMTGLGDIPTFTRLIHDGVEEYVSTLKGLLRRKQRPIVAPVGMAFLTVWEEDNDLWKDLFTSDAIHTSVHGTYLIACVLYMTLFGHRLPDTEVTHPENVPDLFAYSRKLTGQHQQRQSNFPTTAEATYLRNVAKRVSLKGYIPSSFKKSRAAS